MAVEVTSHQAYNVLADVYSWAMVSHEIMSLQKPFSGRTRENIHSNLVCERGARPPVLVSNDPLSANILSKAHLKGESDQSRTPLALIELNREGLLY